jgi:hypothetical protein
VADKLARIRVIRARALLAVNERGKWEDASPTRFRSVDIGDVKIAYRTPLEMAPTETESTRYLRALLGGKPKFAFGLDIWATQKKVLNVEWNDEDAIQIITYRPGNWERALESASG